MHCKLPRGGTLIATWGKGWWCNNRTRQRCDGLRNPGQWTDTKPNQIRPNQSAASTSSAANTQHRLHPTCTMWAASCSSAAWYWARSRSRSSGVLRSPRIDLMRPWGGRGTELGSCSSPDSGLSAEFALTSLAATGEVEVWASPGLRCGAGGRCWEGVRKVFGGCLELVMKVWGRWGGTSQPHCTPPNPH